MGQKYLCKNYKFLSLLLIIFVLVGCGQNAQRPNPEKQEDDSPKLPKVLTELDDEVLKIMYDLDSISGIEEAIQKKKLLEAEQASTSVEAAAQPGGGSENEEPKGSEDKKANTEEESKKIEKEVDMQGLIKENKIIIPLLDASEVKGNFLENPTLPENMDKVWSQISDSVTGVHKKWNVLESQLTPVNVPRQKLEEFEQVLDDLTLSVMNKDKLNSLNLSNELTRITTDFRSYFNGTAEHGVYGMYYHIRSTILFAASNNYAGAVQHLDEASRLGASVRQDLIKKDSQDILQKFELSIEDLRKQLVDENFTLSQIKAPIVIKNIKLIEEDLRTQKSK